MPDIEVHIDLDGRLRRVGLARLNKVRGAETVTFEYAEEWLAAAEYFGLGLAQARALIKEVATATAKWRDVARKAGARASEMQRMASAFEHEELRRALAL